MGSFAAFTNAAFTLALGAALALAIVGGRASLQRLALLLPWLAGVASYQLWQLSQVAAIFDTLRELHERRPDLPDSTTNLDALLRQFHADIALEVVGCALLGLLALAACRALGRPGLPWTARALRLGGEPRVSWRGPFHALGIAAAIVAGFWFLATVTGAPKDDLRELVLPDTRKTQGAWLLAAIGGRVIACELPVRLGVQSLLQWALRKVHLPEALAVLGSTALWMSVAAGPDSLGRAQYALLVPQGLALGWLQLTCGTECCILAQAAASVSLFRLWPVIFPI